MAEKPRIFVVAGMPRAGTTFLYHYIERHSECVPLQKETNYFSVKYGLGEEWFLNLYKNRKSQQLCFDASPPYFLDESAAERIKSFDPNTRVILGFRKPSDWIVSVYGR